MFSGSEVDYVGFWRGDQRPESRGGLRRDDCSIVLEDHRRRISHLGSGQVFVSVLREVIAAEAVPEDVGRKRQAGRFRDGFK